MKVFIFVILTLFLSACGGGGGSGGGGTASTTPGSGGGMPPTTNPVSGGGGGSTPTTPGSGGGTPSITNPGSGGGMPTNPDSMAGQLALKGISRIPLSVGRLSNTEMRKRYVIMDDGFSSSHMSIIRRAACTSYISGCVQDDPSSYPFTQATFKDGLPTALANQNNLLVAVSVQPDGAEFYLAAGAKSGHVAVHAAGNEGTTNFFAVYEYDEANNRFIIVETQQPAQVSTTSNLLRIIAATRDPGCR